MLSRQRLFVHFKNSNFVKMFKTINLSFHFRQHQFLFTFQKQLSLTASRINIPLHVFPVLSGVFLFLLVDLNPWSAKHGQILKEHLAYVNDCRFKNKSDLLCPRLFRFLLNITEKRGISLIICYQCLGRYNLRQYYLHRYQLWNSNAHFKVDNNVI